MTNTEQDRTISLIKSLRQGNGTARETLFSNYRGYIIKLARGYSRKNIDILQTDEYSIALIAFNEALEKFNPEKSTNFPSFAGQVIKRRLIDLARSNNRFKNEIASENMLEIADHKEQDSEEQEDLKDDIARFEKALSEFNISLDDLVKQTPKHKKTRCRAMTMAQEIANDPVLSARMERRKALPFKSLLLRFRCNPKTIQRHRKYIIAVYLALNGSNLYLRDFVLRVAKGCDKYDS